MVLVVKNLPANAGDIRDKGSIPRLGEIPWIRAWSRKPFPILRAGKSHRLRNLVGYSL